MQTELANMAGEYGDLHFQDLAGVLMAGGELQESELRRRFKGVVRNVIELSELVKKAFANSRARNVGVAGKKISRSGSTRSSKLASRKGCSQAFEMCRRIKPSPHTRDRSG